MLRSNGPTRRHAGWLAGTRAVAGLLLMMVFALAGTSAGAQVRVRPAAPPPAVTGNDCPSMVYAAGADLYPAMPSFHAGYVNLLGEAQRHDGQVGVCGVRAVPVFAVDVLEHLQHRRYSDVYDQPNGNPARSRKCEPIQEWGSPSWRHSASITCT